MPISYIRERVNLLLYGYKSDALKIVRTLTLLVSFIAISSLIYFYGFPQTSETKEILLNIIKFSFAYYVLSYCIRLFYSFDIKSFIKETWIEGLMMLFLIIEGISFNFFGILLIQTFFIEIGFETVAHFTTLFIQFYFLIVVLVELTRSTTIIPQFKVHPANLFMMSYFIMISGGTILLSLPEMTIQAGSMSIIDALFMSTSATCVTGLAVDDVATFFTFKGHVVILILIKLGGLNIITFGSFIAFFSKFGIGIKHHGVVEDFVHKESLFSARGMVGSIIIWSIIIELIGAFLIFTFWSPQIQFQSTGERLFYSIFHSVSAFNNAGITLFTDGLYHEFLRHNYIIHLLITALVFMGALGFAAIFDLFDIKKMRERLRYPWRKIQFGTKIALYLSVALTIIGMVAYFVLERNDTLEGQDFIAASITSLFQSVTRTSGFNTVDIGSLTLPMVILMLFLMFIGGSSGSTAGGIKTSSFGLILGSVYSTILGKKNPEMFNRTIPNDLINKSFAIFFFFTGGILMVIFSLSLTENHILMHDQYGIIHLIFEAVSAFSTVGLSMGITGELSEPGRIIIILSMFIGRVGTLTVAYTLGRKVISTRYKYPYGHTMVG